MLDHVVLLLKENACLMVKNTSCSLLNNIQDNQTIPITVNEQIFNDKKVLKVTMKEQLVCIVNGYDYKFPGCCLNVIAIRNTNKHMLEIPSIMHVNSVMQYKHNKDNVIHCYTTDGNFPIYQNEMVDCIKEINNSFIEISLYEK